MNIAGIIVAYPMNIEISSGLVIIHYNISMIYQSAHKPSFLFNFKVSNSVQSREELPKGHSEDESAAVYSDLLESRISLADDAPDGHLELTHITESLSSQAQSGITSDSRLPESNSAPNG